MRDVDEPRYVAPPAYAPPELRVAPLNESAFYATSTYPGEQQHVAVEAWGDADGDRDDDPLGFGWSTAPEPGPRRWWRTTSLLVPLCVVVALGVIAAVLVSSERAAPQHTLSLPRSFDSYTRLDILPGSRVATLFAAGTATFRGVGIDDLDSALVGIYGSLDDTKPSMLFIGFRADQSPTIGSGLHAEPAGAIAAQVLDEPGSTISPQPADAGPLGGAIRCATVVLNGALASAGVWADHDTLGIVLIDNASLTANTAQSANRRTATITRAFRSAAEH